MEPLTWYEIGRWALTALVGILIFVWGFERKHVAAAIKGRFDRHNERHVNLIKRVDEGFEAVTNRFEAAGEKISNLASVVQSLVALPARLEDLRRIVEQDNSLRREQLTTIERTMYAQSQEIAVLRERIALMQRGRD